MTDAPPAAQDLWTDKDPRLHLSVWKGDGPPLLLTHGMAGNAHWWETTAPLLAGRFSPVALDFRGHGDSDWRADGAYTTDAFVADIEDARQALGLSRFVLCGHSLGARVALEYARRQPRRLSHLIAVDFLPEAYRSGSRRFERTRSAPQPLYADERAMLERFRLQPPGTRLTPDELRELGRASLRKSGAGYTWKFDWRSFRYLYEPIWEALPRVETPTLVVRGEHSPVLPREPFDRAVKALRLGQGVEIAGAHHHVPLDAPRALARAIESFVR